MRHGTHGGAAEILVVDDDDVLRETLADSLTIHGFKVAAEPSGVDALCYLLANAAPRVILIDARMPETAGGELFDQLRAMQGVSHARIVVYMADATADEPHLRALGVFRVLRGPLAMLPLIAVLKEIA